MNRFLSMLSIASILLQPYTAMAQAPMPSPVAMPTPAPLSDQQTFTLDQPTKSLELEYKIVEDVFEDRKEPDTCYHDVQRGMKTECNTEYDQQCSTRTETECENVPYPVCADVSRRVCEDVPRRSCQNVPEQVCETVNDQVCHSEDQRVCTNVPRRECRKVEQCRTVTDTVCDPVSNPTPTRSGPTRGDTNTGPTRGNTGPTRGSSGSTRGFELASAAASCREVPRRVCETVDKCETTNDQVCHSEPRRVCTNVPRRQCHSETRQSCSTVYDNVCHNETRQECHDEYKRECRQVPRQTCVDVPRQVCEQVPNMVSEPYACTRDVRVKVGERTKIRVSANAKIVVTNFGQVEVNGNELMARIATSAAFDLGKRDVKAEIVLSLGKNDQKVLYRVLKKEASVQVISETEKRIQTVFYLELMSLDQLSALNSLKVSEPKLTYEKLQFKLSSATSNADLSSLVAVESGALEVVMVKGRRLYTIIDDKFNPALVLKKTAAGYEINFSSFDIQYLQGRSHKVHLELSFKSTLNRDEFLNPDLLRNVSIKPVIGEFEGFPTE